MPRKKPKVDSIKCYQQNLQEILESLGKCEMLLDSWGLYTEKHPGKLGRSETGDDSSEKVARLSKQAIRLACRIQQGIQYIQEEIEKNQQEVEDATKEN